jgi:hypothetical protein
LHEEENPLLAVDAPKSAQRTNFDFKKRANQLVRRTCGPGENADAVPGDHVAQRPLSTLGPLDGLGLDFGLLGPETAYAVEVVGGNGEVKEDGDLGLAEDEDPRSTLAIIGWSRPPDYG